MASENNVQTLFNVAALAMNTLSERGEGSVIEYASAANNILTATVEDRLTHHDITSNILKLSTNLYAGYYVQAVAMMATVGNLQVRQVLDRLNPKRDLIANTKDAVVDNWHSIESAYQYPVWVNVPNYSLEDNAWDINKTDTHPGSTSVNSSGTKNLNTWASEAPNLAVGKIFEVEICSNGSRAVIPTRVVISPITCNSAMFISMYAEGNLNNTFMNRIKRWQVGELSTIGDMIFCNDIISEKAKILKQDKLGIVKELEKRRLSNKLSTLITNKTSIATASTISIITKDTDNELALSLGGKLTDHRMRDLVFLKSGLVIMAIVDEMYETVTLYFRGETHGNHLTFKECQIASKGNGPNPMEILKAFQAGQTPNI